MSSRPWATSRPGADRRRKIRARLDVLLEQTQADELIFTCDLYETADRHRAFEIVAELRQ
ncbi:hypothetical protein [Stutzerimonas xanthomarina]|uniref:hypothetical protein n=1 Tax=Stutzerimonas xanthomarina TaxID=271420 RepID=UPI003AA9186D